MNVTAIGIGYYANPLNGYTTPTQPATLPKVEPVKNNKEMATTLYQSKHQQELIDTYLASAQAAQDDDAFTVELEQHNTLILQPSSSGKPVPVGYDTPKGQLIDTTA